MKGCARSLLFQLVGFALVLAGVFYFFQERHGLPPTKVMGGAIFSALFAAIGLGLFISISKPLRDRAALRDCMAGKRPRDGKQAGIAGTIDLAGGSPLRSPMSGSECLAYRYEIWAMVPGFRRQTKATYYEGIALVPSVIATPAGPFRLFAVPEFDFGMSEVPRDQALVHWAEHARTATFQPWKARTVEKQWTDDDGAYASEKRNVEGEDPDFSNARFREDLIRRGDHVYAVGLFSEARGGLVPHPNWANITRIMKGDPESILSQLGKRIVRYAIFGIVFLGASAGVIAAVLSNAAR